jgi:hypothetical protein
MDFNGLPLIIIGLISLTLLVIAAKLLTPKSKEKYLSLFSNLGTSGTHILIIRISYKENIYDNFNFLIP